MFSVPYAQLVSVWRCHLPYISCLYTKVFPPFRLILGKVMIIGAMIQGGARETIVPHLHHSQAPERQPVCLPWLQAATPWVYVLMEDGLKWCFSFCALELQG
jgi:hypothetical protein